MRFVRLNRKSRIPLAVAFIFAAVLAGLFWPDEYADAVSVEFAGASSGDSNVVAFTITNRSKKEFALKLGTLTFPSNGHWEELDLTLANPHVLPGRSSTKCSDRVFPLRQTHRWRLAVGYTVAVMDSPVYRVRWHLREYVHRAGWERIGEWILPAIPDWRHAYGPEMLGDQPMRK